MLKRHIKLTLRNMRKNKIDTVLNLSGITLGLALTLLIVFHTQEELRYE
ncbi:hypothetical protein JXA70_10705 [candidate division KSB1 bacterium]|nr:hypothetical protein [candidate division KSB1 bacterium]